jgi:UDP-glucose 4-epimerase
MTKILINGLGSPLGAAVARRLSERPEVMLIGLARTMPPAPIGRAEWLTARLKGRQVAELLAAEAVDVVIHLDFAGADAPAAGREEAIQQNVLGSMELLGACAAAGVQRVVLRSHVGVYGPLPSNPIFITERRSLARQSVHGLLRDFAEVEQFAAEFADAHPELAITTLRCAHLMGCWSPLAAYLGQPNPLMLVGFDPCFQLLHLEDAAEAFALAALAEASGPFNIASSDTLALSQAIRLAGQQPQSIFEPLLGIAATMGGREPLGNWPYAVGFLRHSCVVDTHRAHGELGWAPTYMATDILQTLRRNGQSPCPEEAAAALQAFLARRSAS